jgi:hypothetical protein
MLLGHAVHPRKLPVPESIASQANRGFANRFMAATGMVLFPSSANAVKGAFEMDMDFYIDGLLGKKPPPIRKALRPSPRTLDRSYASRILDIVQSNIVSQSESSRKALQELVESKVPGLLPYFMTFAPVSKEDISDQYYFDITMYATYLEAAKLIPKSEQRVMLRDSIGNDLIASLDMAKPSPEKSTIDIANGYQEMLKKFVDVGIISSYDFDDEDLRDLDYVEKTLGAVSIRI